MAQIPIPEHWKQLWDTWDLRAFIFLSLLIQLFLVLFAPFRKRTSRAWIIMPLWSAYLLADWAANFAVGLISSSESNDLSSRNDKGVGNSGDLLAFWAPFLLVHLGGPDTITAFALEDNELWLRHLFGLVFQCIAAVYVFIQSLPNKKLWLPTCLMFLAGIIKYAERTRSLYLASASKFRDSMLTEPDPGPNYAKLMDEYHSKKMARLPTRIEMLPEPDRVVKAADIVKKDDLTDVQVVQYAYRYFMAFKGLVVDLIFSFRERNQSRDFFLARNDADAFRVVEVELNFLYEVLFTKIPVVYDKIGYWCRSFSFAAEITSLLLFHSLEKKGFKGFDVGLTYTLLGGAIVIDLIAFVMLILSDWTAVKLRPAPDVKPSDSIASKLITMWLNIVTKRFNLRSANFLGIPLRIIGRRWAESVSTYNLIYYCLNKRSKTREAIYAYLGLTSFLDNIWYVERKEFTDPLRKFIFQELKIKSEMADDIDTSKEICSSKGEWVVRFEGNCAALLPFVADVDYDESLILWHIATELCYNEENHNEEANEHRDFAKLISGYMIYLLVMQPNMMSAVSGIGLIRFQDTCAEVVKFFKGGKLELERDKTELQKACDSILAVNTEVKPVTIKGDRSKSVLFDAAILAKELKKLNANKWVIMSKVWLELLSYAATHIRSNSHAQQLSKGGELITIVWLLMAHLGLGVQFQISEGHARAKLIVGK